MYQRSRQPTVTHTDIPSRPQHASLIRTNPSEHQQREHLEEPVVQMEGVYIISVAARILDMHPQTLRKYEKLGLINPGRTLGMLRLYSRDDIRKVRLIQHLAGNLGLNLAGVEFALCMVENLIELKRRLTSAVEGTQLQSIIEQEMALLFHSMDLPLED